MDSVKAIMVHEKAAKKGDITRIRALMRQHGWFADHGAYVLVDGQFGSTGKGLLASVLATALPERIDIVTTNAGPNSGHTAYFGDEQIVTKQIPIASIIANKMGGTVHTHLNAGAVIDPGILAVERIALGRQPLTVHPDAAIIDDECTKETNSDIASTGKGVGPAMARKIGRKPSAVVSGHFAKFTDVASIVRFPLYRAVEDSRILVETAQGFSLGINSGFYPYTTSRECTVGQALADARIPVTHLRKSIVCLRTYPIRVGNTPDGYSGDWYSDQLETDWGRLRKKPEMTTVTGRVRRVASFSLEQWRECVLVNRPDAIFLNFMNYLEADEQHDMVRSVLRTYRNLMHRDPDFMLLGYGPRVQDVRAAYLDEY